MKRKNERKSISSPHRSLIPVIILLSVNLVIYLYIIAKNITIGDLIPLDFSKLQNYLLIASYFTTTFAMLLTMTGYFNIKADLRRFKVGSSDKIMSAESQTDDIVQPVEEGEINDEPPSDIVSKPEGVVKNDNNVSPEKSVGIAAKTEESEKDAAKIKDNEVNTAKGWKKIGIKIPEKSEETISETVQDAEAPEVSEENQIEIDQSQGEEITVSEEEAVEVIEEPSAPSSEENVDEQNPVNESMPIDEEENEIRETETIQTVNLDVPREIMEDSEVLRNLEDIKKMVDEMKIKLEEKRSARAKSELRV